MATIQKGAKINFYKFVQVQSPTSSAVRSDESAALTKTINTNTQAVNNLGATVNSIGKILASVKKASILQLEMEEKNRKKFQAEYTEELRRKKKSAASPLAVFKKPSFLEGLFNFLSGLIKAAIIIPALKWLSDPENREKVERIIEVISKVATFIFDVAKFGVVNTIEGLYTLLSDESSPWEKVGGLVRGLVGLGTLLLGLRWLSNPLTVVKDFGNVLKFFRNNLLASKAKLGIGAKVALGTAATFAVMEGVFTAPAGDSTVEGNKDMPLGITPGTEGIGPVADGGRYGQVLENIQESKKPKEEPGGLLGFLNNIFKSNGGKIPQAAQGGWISGPQSGYPVSLDGGRSTSFIGHGTEYVARKANGGAFVVPFNTPGTKTQPHLTQKRIGEAKSLGFNVPGFANGGIVGTKEEKWQQVVDMAAKAGAKYPNLVAAQFALESAWGTALSANNNFFGIKATANESATTSSTHEVYGGKTVYIDARFKNFATPQDAINHLVTQWYKDYRGYKGVNNASDKFAAAQMLKSEGYATDPVYAESLSRLMREYSGIRASNNTSPTASPTGSGSTSPEPAQQSGGIGSTIKNLLGMEESKPKPMYESAPKPEPEKKDKGNWFQQFWRGLTGNEFGATTDKTIPPGSNQSTLLQEQEEQKEKEKDEQVKTVSEQIMTLGDLMPKGVADSRSMAEIMGVERTPQFREKKKERDLKKQTESRNKARKKVTDKSQAMIKTVVSAIAEQNGVNSQAIAAATQAIQVAIGENANANVPIVAGGSSSMRSRSVASSLGSNLNLLRGILR